VASEAKSVNALTYGLVNLCLGSNFTERTRWLRGYRAKTVGSEPARSIDNQYARYTRKFSLGNGPPIWVAEYAINPERAARC
jgi:hypothetical protein